METKYTVVSVRKSDGVTFFSENIRKCLFDSEQEAQEEAVRKARELSRDYVYVVYILKPVLSVEYVFPPIEVKRF